MNASQLHQQLSDNKTKRGGFFTGSNLLLVGIFACMLLTGFVPQEILAVPILLFSALLIGSGKIYLVYPPMLFYYNFFGLFFGMSVYRWFSFIFLFITLLEKRDIRLHRRQLAPLFLFVFYCVLVIVPGNLRRAVFAVMDMVCICVLINQYLHVIERLKAFFSIYALTALCAFVTGTQRDSIEQAIMFEGQVMEMSRNTATFEDPNYMGYFYTAAVFALVALRLFNPKIRALFVVALYAILLSSLSITAVVVNIVLWLAYLFITRKINLKVLSLVVIIISLLVGLYQYGLKNPETPVVGGISMRISTKLEEAQEGDFNSVTSNRVDLSSRHWDYFVNQPLHKQLFGMNAASMLKMDVGGLTLSGHNEYVDMLLNVGVLGSMILMGFLLRRLWWAHRTYRNNGDESALFMIMGKLVWLGYALTLTVYGDFRFQLLFLL